MYHSDYLKAILLAQKVHEKMLGSIDPRKYDKQLAMYYLQGGCITYSHLALAAWGRGDLNAVWRSKRIIDESFDMLMFLGALPDGDRHIKAWFDDRMGSIPDLEDTKYISIKKALIKRTFLNNEEMYERHMRLRRDIMNEFSKGVHPYFHTVAFNADTKLAKYDYTCETMSFYPIDNFDFAVFIITPALQTILSNIDILPVEPDDWRMIREQLEHISDISKKMHGGS